MALGTLACAAPGRRAPDADYLRYVAVEVPGGEHVLLRWSERDMPLRIHLPRPDPGLFRDPDAVLDAVRDGVTDWSDVAGPGLPSFVFVDDPGRADIPIVWEHEPSGDWYIAHCVPDIDPFARRFGIARILVTAQYDDRERAVLDDLYLTMLHEVGHALGLNGHSPDPGDVMYPRVTGHARGALSPRDRETLRRLYARPNGHRVIGARDTD